jgi:AraC-like DNA-binding protein
MILSAAPRTRQHLERTAGERHRFIVMEMSRPWVSRWMPAGVNGLRAPVNRFLKPGRGVTPSSEVHKMTAPLAQLAADVLTPPRAPASRACWHHAKALEMVSLALFVSDDSELFCERTKRVGRERIVRVQAILSADLENPPSLAELGRKVGCSPFYLSRVFRQETGITLSAWLRRIRMERAAELLRAGEANVTEAAMTVGYSSLSHFSKAFAVTFGCCPCLYGRKS